MGWVDALKGHKVGLDTAPLIYFTEQNGAYLKKVDPFFAALAKGELQVVTSVQKATFFLTNDIVLSSLTDIKILVLDVLKDEDPDKET